MKLFLSGGGSGLDSMELDKKYIQSLDLSKPVLYIPIAINTEKHPYSGCLAWIKDNFKPLGFENFVMWTEDDLRKKTENDFKEFGGIYIGGGNTFKLLKELKEFGTFNIIKKFANGNVPIYGGSAGAGILARTVIPALSADLNDVGLADFSALNLLNDYDIWCHYKGTMDEEIYRYIKKYNLKKIIAIPENAGLCVTESLIEVVGPSGVFVFLADKKKEATPGSLI